VRSTGSLTTGNREGWRLFGRACQRARLTEPQRAAAILAAEGQKFRAIALSLKMSYRSARQTLRHAECKLRRVLQRVIDDERRFIRHLLDCIKNVHDPRPAPVFQYAPVPGGTYDFRPVSFRPRPEGECPEDLLMPRLRVLSELSTRLAECAVRFCG
jgi:hypothetical protein